MRVLCASKGRADRVISKILFPSLKLIVPQSELPDYEENNPEVEVVGTPDSVRGITATRQWILDEYSDDGIFMIDDDIKSMVRVYVEAGELEKVEDPELVLAIVEQTEDVAIQMDAKLWGFRSVRNPAQFVSQYPVVCKGYLNTSYMGLIKGHNLSFDLSFTEGEDHYLNLINKYYNRYHLQESRWTFMTEKNFQNLGGCAGNRTIDDMKKNTLKLRKLFGERIKFKQATSMKKNVYEGERSINFNF